MWGILSLKNFANHIREVEMTLKEPKRPFLVVYPDEIATHGVGAAILLSELRFLSKRFAKDDHGYFEIFGSYLCEQLKISKPTLIKLRSELIRAKKIDFIHGKNQNSKCRYKILL